MADVVVYGEHQFGDGKFATVAAKFALFGIGRFVDVLFQCGRHCTTLAHCVVSVLSSFKANCLFKTNVIGHFVIHLDKELVFHKANLIGIKNFVAGTHHFDGLEAAAMLEVGCQRYVAYIHAVVVIAVGKNKNNVNVVFEAVG